MQEYEQKWHDMCCSKRISDQMRVTANPS